MKKILLSSFAALAFAGSSAFAADLRMPVKAPYAPPPAVASWTGCYIDGGVGYGLWNQDHSVTNTGLAVTTVTTTDGGRGWLGRVGGGCDFEVGSRFVLGAFADYDFMGLNGSNTPNELLVVPGIGTSPITANMKETGAWYVGGRIGYLVTPSVLAYIDGGFTQTRFTQTSEFLTATGTPVAFSYPGAYNTNGWFLGGGYEYGLDILPIHGLFWRTEYRFAQYESRDLAEFSTTTGAATGNVEHSKAYVQTVTSGLVWRFNFGR